MLKQDPPRRARTTAKKGPKGTNELTGSSFFKTAPPSRITNFRVRGTGKHIELPTVVTYTVGREPTPDDTPEPRADVLLPTPRKGVSLVHATFEWRGDRLWCRDAASTNGTMANHEPQRDWFNVSSGMRLDFGDTSVIAMDWRLTDLCEPLAWCLGLDAIQEVDRAVSLVQKDGPLLLTGPRDGDQEWLARKIHEASARREQPFTAFTTPLGRGAEDKLDEAGFGTVFVDLTAVGKVTAAFASRLFEGQSPHLKLRPIIAAETHNESHRAFQQLGQGHTLALPSLEKRRHEVERLLDQLMDNHESTLRIRDLGSPWAERLVEYEWAGLGELREAERRIRALLENGNNKTLAAKQVGMSRQAFTKFLTKILGRTTSGYASTATHRSRRP